MSPVNLVGTDIAVNNSPISIDVVFVLTNQLERIVLRPSGDTDADRPHRVCTFDPEGKQERAWARHDLLTINTKTRQKRACKPLI